MYLPTWRFNMFCFCNSVFTEYISTSHYCNYHTSWTACFQIINIHWLLWQTFYGVFLLLFLLLLHLTLILIVQNYFFSHENTQETSCWTFFTLLTIQKLLQMSLEHSHFDQLLSSHPLINKHSKTVKLAYLKHNLYNQRTTLSIVIADKWYWLPHFRCLKVLQFVSCGIL